MIRQTRQGNKEAKENLETENRLRKEQGLPSVEEELAQMAKDPKVQAQVLEMLNGQSASNT